MRSDMLCMDERGSHSHDLHAAPHVSGSLVREAEQTFRLVDASPLCANNALQVILAVYRLQQSSRRQVGTL